MSDDINDFLVEMADVAAIKQDKIAHSQSQIIKNQPAAIKNRKQAAIRSTEKYVNFLTDGEVEQVKPDELLSYKISGIQPQVFKKLRLGAYPQDYHLDLHRHNVQQARQAVFELFSQTENDTLRCFLITHGKGHRSNPPAKLKSYVNHWLKQIVQVIAFHSAIPKQGGGGSVYVLLKKAKHLKTINQKKYL
ncbi:MAG: DNA endonuclease SmrA [Enterobacterales bacterium]|nr:DNA endonuclease SmrA [Enterobacterales bacterium]